MKLFHQLLVAPAALGLLAPLSVNAAEININGISQYNFEPEEEEVLDYNFNTILPTDWAYTAISDLVKARKCSASIPLEGFSRFEAATILNSCLSGQSTNLTSVEVKLINEFSEELASINAGTSTPVANTFEAGGFADTSTLSGSAEFLVGSTDGDDVIQLDDRVAVMHYAYTLESNTSFTGEDNLFVEIEGGNSLAAGTLTGMLDFGAANGDALKVSELSYTRPFGEKLTFAVGDSMDLSTLFTGACRYEAFTDALSNCGTANTAYAEGDISVSTNFDFGNGINLGFGVSGKEEDQANTVGLLTKQSSDRYAIQVAYTADSYGAAVTYGNQDVAGGTDFGYWGLNAYYSFGSFIDSINVGYEVGDASAGGTDTKGGFIGLTTQNIGPGSISIAMGTNDDVLGTTQITDDAGEVYLYEIAYGWDVNDSVSASLGAFTQERSTYQGDNLTGVALTTTFSF